MSKDVVTMDLSNCHLKKLTRPENDLNVIQFPIPEDENEMIKMLGGNHRINQVKKYVL